MSNVPAFTFRDIDLPRHAALCVQIRADSYACGDGTPDRFYASAGPAGQHYLAKLAERLRTSPGTQIHAFLDDQVVGQIELIYDSADPAAGKVNLFYLLPAYRHRGLGAQLERYALAHFRARGLTRAWLRVSPTNAPAVAFYRKHAWHDRGPDAKNLPMHIMDKPL